MRLELPWYDVNYRYDEHHNTSAGKIITELHEFLEKNWIKWWLYCLDEKWQVVRRYTDRVVLEIDGSVSPEKLEKIKKMISELLRVMWATETQLADVFQDKDIGKVKKIIIKDLKEKHIKVEKAIEFGMEWEKISINLPAKWKFEWFKFECFKPLEGFYWDKLEWNQDLVENLCSMKDISSLLKSLNNYMREYWVSMDENVNFDKDLQFWNHEVKDTSTRRCLHTIMPKYEGEYWLKDEDVGWEKGVRATWYSDGLSCFFDRDRKWGYRDTPSRNILLKNSN